MRPCSNTGARIRILFYSHTGLISGAEHVLLNTIAGLDRIYYEPIVACPMEGELKSRVEVSSIPVFPMRVLQARFTSSALKLLRYLRSFYLVISELRSLVRQLKPDLIHANSVRAGIVATVATIGTGISVLWHIHDDLPQHPISTIIRLGAYLSKRSIFLAVSSSTSQAFCGKLLFAKRMHVLHNGIDLARFSRRQCIDQSFRVSLGITQRELLICAVGMINPRKDLIGLLRAFKTIHDTNPSVHLAIVGQAIFNRDDLYLTRVRQLSEELGLSSVVHFAGPHKDIPRVLRACDLLVLNAKVEPFGLVLIEAMASGTPVMATCVGGIPEIVTDGETGILVPAANPEALAARLLETIARPDKLGEIADRAYAEVHTRFSLERYNTDYQTILKLHLDQQPESTMRVMPPASHLRVALFHDNFAQSGGAERVVEELHRTLIATHPNTHLLSTLTAKERLSSYLGNVPIRNTWMQHLPAKAKLFRAYFLLYPLAVDHADLSHYDLIVTSCFGYAKGVRRHQNSLHICYCHTPMRWVWRTEDYLSREKNGRLKQLALSLPIRWLKAWELQAASRPDFYIANSTVVANRLFHAFGIHAVVIPPPIDTGRFSPKADLNIAQPENFYLILSRLVPYKRLDLAVEACTRTHRKLIVIGSGPDRKRLESLAGQTVTFLGRAPIEVVVGYAQRCQALLFPGEEDFGMTPIEINAAGRPVVAYRGGGATETIIEGLNGLFFNEPTTESMIAAIECLEATQWNSSDIQRHAKKFDTTVFVDRINSFIDKALRKKQSKTEARAVPVGA